MRMLLSVTALLSITVATSVLADPPARVGRLSYAEGTVSERIGSDAQWAPAMVNYPVTSQNSFWTEPGAKAEIQVGPLEVRLDQSTELDVQQLDDSATQLQLPQGVLNVHLESEPLSPIQIITPEGAINLTHAGSYHIDAGNQSNPQTVLTVLEGEAGVQGASSMLPIAQGESAVISGNPPAVALEEGNATPFDDWALSREHRDMAMTAPQYVSPQITGAQDLNAYGSWSPQPTYGQVWYPQSVPSGWAPYRDGHWAFVAPWGWTWVDNAPWGFAPFHYGRWVHDNDRWGWCPGAEVERPVYAPALVAFIGGSGWNLSISAGMGSAIGWVPLGPSEVFHPYYHTSPDYYRNINSPNVSQTIFNRQTINNYNNSTHVTINNYRNGQAATVMPSGDFANGAPVRGHALHVTSAQIASAPVVKPAVNPVAATPAARFGGGLHAQPNRSIGHPPEVMQHLSPRPAMAQRVNAAPAAFHGAAVPPAARLPYVGHAAVVTRPVAMQRMPQVEVPLHAAVPPQARQGSYPLSANNAPQHKERPALAVKPEQVKAAVTHSTAFERPQATPYHPQQSTQIRPTPQGWKRGPAQPMAHAEAPHPAQAARKGVPPRDDKGHE